MSCFHPFCRPTMFRGVAALILGLGALILAACAPASDAAADHETALDLQLSTFHRAPTQAAFSAILAQFHQRDDEPGMRANASLMASFVIFAVDHYGLSVAGAPGSAPLERFLGADRVKFTAWLEDASGSPKKNDVLWMAFFCTGETRWLDRLFAVATTAIPAPPDGKSQVIDLTVSTARWSYKSNVAQWPEVLAHAQRQAAAGDAFALECVAYAKEHPEADHPLSAPTGGILDQRPAASRTPAGPP